MAFRQPDRQGRSACAFGPIHSETREQGKPLAAGFLRRGRAAGEKPHRLFTAQPATDLGVMRDVDRPVSAVFDVINVGHGNLLKPV